MSGNAMGMERYFIYEPNGTRELSREEFERMSKDYNPAPITSADRFQDLYARGDLTADAFDDVLRKSQRFFSEMAAEIRKPHCAEHQKQFTRAMLNRAQEFGLYQPEDT